MYGIAYFDDLKTIRNMRLWVVVVEKELTILISIFSITANSQYTAISTHSRWLLWNFPRGLSHIYRRRRSRWYRLSDACGSWYKAIRYEICLWDLSIAACGGTSYTYEAPHAARQVSFWMGRFTGRILNFDPIIATYWLLWYKFKTRGYKYYVPMCFLTFSIRVT